MTALVAASLELALRLLPTRPKRLVVAGGGRKNPVLMAEAMKYAIEAGRLAYLAGRMPKKLYASASSPLEGLIR